MAASPSDLESTVRTMSAILEPYDGRVSLKPAAPPSQPEDLYYLYFCEASIAKNNADKISAILAEIGILGASGNPKFVANHGDGPVDGVTAGVVLTESNLNFISNKLQHFSNLVSQKLERAINDFSLSDAGLYAIREAILKPA